MGVGSMVFSAGLAGYLPDELVVEEELLMGGMKGCLTNLAMAGPCCCLWLCQKVPGGQGQLG